MSAIQSLDELEASAVGGGEPPVELSGPLKALWLTKADRWHKAHDVAQDLGSKLGDWIHALLHLIEGDLGNSAYWYRRASQPQPQATEVEIDAEWRKIAQVALDKAQA